MVMLKLGAEVGAPAMTGWPGRAAAVALRLWAGMLMRGAGVGKAADAASSAATAGGGGASDGSATAGTDVMSQIMAEVGRRRNSIVSRTGGDDSDEWDE